MNRTINNQIKIGISLFLIITVLSYTIISYFFLSQIPKHFNINTNTLYILLAVLLYIAFHTFNIIRVYELLKIFTKTFSIYDAIVFTLGGVFLGTITPFQSGGIPLQLYIMKKRDVNTGQGMSVLFIRGIQSFIVFLLTVPFTAVFFSYLFDNNIVSALLKYFLFFYMGVIIFLIIFVFFPNVLIIIKEKINNKYIDKIVNALTKQSYNFKTSLKIYLNNGKKHFILSCVYTFLSMYSMFIMAYFINLIFRGENNFFLIFNIQLLLTYLLAFVPTPGSSGFAEGGIGLFYMNIIPSYNIVAFIFLWRLLSTYIPAFFGMIIVLKSFKFILNYDKGGNDEKDIS